MRQLKKTKAVKRMQNTTNIIFILVSVFIELRFKNLIEIKPALKYALSDRVLLKVIPWASGYFDNGAKRNLNTNRKCLDGNNVTIKPCMGDRFGF